MLWLDSGLLKCISMEIPQGNVPTILLLREKMASFQRIPNGQSMVCVQKSCCILQETTLPLCREMTDSPQQAPWDCQLRNMVRGTKPFVHHKWPFHPVLGIFERACTPKTALLAWQWKGSSDLFAEEARKDSHRYLRISPADCDPSEPLHGLKQGVLVR